MRPSPMQYFPVTPLFMVLLDLILIVVSRWWRST